MLPFLNKTQSRRLLIRGEDFAWASHWPHLFLCAIKECQSSKQRTKVANKLSNLLPPSTDFSGFIMFEVHWAPESVDLCLLPELGSFQPSSLQTFLFFCDPLSLLLLRHYNTNGSGPTDPLGSFHFFNHFSLCCSDWIISNDLSSNSLTSLHFHSAIESNL